ncbi:MAG: flagellar protein FlaG [Lachnospiraceae bacterium]|nr:flagellar protein FlaG [Lachnospiraceae bacterium]
MSIEPIGNTMAYQAAPAVKPAEPVQSETSEEVAARTGEGNIAASQVVVNEVAPSDQDGASNAGQGGQQPTDTKNEQIKKAVEEFNKKVLKQNSEAVFGIHEETNRVTIKIVDKASKKVIKELPPEKTLDMIARVWEMAGILVDEKK